MSFVEEEEYVGTKIPFSERVLKKKSKTHSYPLPDIHDQGTKRMKLYIGPIDEM